MVMMIIVFALGVAVGVIIVVSEKDKVSNFFSGQKEKKVENKQRVLELIQNKQKVTNNDIEELLGVSDSTATRYLEELEQEQKIAQVGNTGKGVYYILK